MKRYLPRITLRSVISVLVGLTLAACGNSQSNTNGAAPTTSTIKPLLQTSSTTQVDPLTKPTTGTTGTTSSSTTLPTIFGNTVISAMSYIENQSVRMPLMAPTEPQFNPTVSHLAAQSAVAAHGTYYAVNLYATNNKVPLNSSSLSVLSATDIIGSFGASLYSSASKAQSGLFALQAENSIAPPYQPTPSLSPKNIDLGNNISGQVYSSSSSSKNNQGTPMVIWHESKWTFEVWDGTISADITQAEKIVTYVHSHELPNTYGVFGENIAGDGNHTSAMWVFGSTDYNVFDYHSGIQAAQMAASMRTFPDGYSKP